MKAIQKTLIALLLFTNWFISSSDLNNNTSNAGTPPSITFKDEKDNQADFNAKFIHQNSVLHDLIEDFPGQNIYQLPERISMQQFTQFYTNALDGFQNTDSLHALTDYIIYADKLGNAEAQQTLESLIQKKLNNPPSKITKEWKNDIEYAEKHLSHYLGLSKKNFSLNLAIQRAQEKMLQSNQPKKQLNPVSFQQQFIDQVKRKNNWIQHLMRQDPSTEIIYSLPDASTVDLPENTPLVEYTLIRDPDIRLVWSNKLTQRQRSKNFTYLDENYWKVNKKGLFKSKSFDWDKVYMLAASNNNSILAFAAPGSLAITARPVHAEPQSYVINLKSIQSNALCSHIAFSCDRTKVSCIVNNEPYIIDLATKTITPTHIPHAFSSILVSNRILLIRTLNGNTFTYDLATKQLNPLTDSTIDWYLNCYAKDDTVLVVGIQQSTDDKNQSQFEVVSQSIDLTTINQD